ncbi:MAG: FHA domain-containing protein [Nitratireductor sp.]
MFPLRIEISHQQENGETATSFVLLPEAGLYTVGRNVDQSIIFEDDRISGKHLTLDVSPSAIVIEDVGSTNGTTIDGREVRKEVWDLRRSLVLAGIVTLHVVSTVGIDEGPVTLNAEDRHQTIVAERGSFGEQHEREVQAFHELFMGRQIVDINAISQSGHLKFERDFIAIGGGIGSFTWVDHLRVFGVGAERIGVIGENEICHANYERYCQASQIPRHERLRSNSASTPDNVWGFPGYALREAIQALRLGKISGVRGIFQVFMEPVLAESYTPRAGDVFRSLEVEMQRIGWDSMFRKGIVRALRKTSDGRYAVFFKAAAGVAGEKRNCIALARHVHVATGYPAVNFVNDLARFRIEHRERSGHVVNAYLDHEHVYEHMALAEHTTVIVRGRGIVASRILQKLAETRAKNAANITVVHLMRSPINHRAGARFGRARRSVFNDVEVQPFNWPKSCWGGELRTRLEAMPQAQRARALAVLGGTTTAIRSDWIELAEQGQEEGWYRKIYGSVIAMEPHGDTVRVTIERSGDIARKDAIDADYVIDCTGLVGEVTNSSFLADLLATYSLPRNELEPAGKERPASRGGIMVTNDFEIAGMRHGSGSVHCSGQICGGGHYAPVDSFLGLQYAALRAVDHLSVIGGAVPPLGPVRSFSGWLKWCRGVAP